MLEGNCHKFYIKHATWEGQFYIAVGVSQRRQFCKHVGNILKVWRWRIIWAIVMDGNFWKPNKLCSFPIGRNSQASYTFVSTEPCKEPRSVRNLPCGDSEYLELPSPPWNMKCFFICLYILINPTWITAIDGPNALTQIVKETEWGSDVPLYGTCFKYPSAPFQLPDAWIILKCQMHKPRVN